MFTHLGVMMVVFSGFPDCFSWIPILSLQSCLCVCYLVSYYIILELSVSHFLFYFDSLYSCVLCSAVLPGVSLLPDGV